MEELDSFGCDLITSRLHLPPDRCSPGNHFYIGGKGLDHHITLVTYSLQRRCDRLPINMIVARCPAITAASVEMPEVFARFADCRSLVLFLDIHVENIQVQTQRFAADILDHLQPLD